MRNTHRGFAAGIGIWRLECVSRLFDSSCDKYMEYMITYQVGGASGMYCLGMHLHIILCLSLFLSLDSQLSRFGSLRLLAVGAATILFLF